MVNRDDIRKLIGGYATGTLTESERKLLFEAALEDQDLFDELAREQALKEALEQPGAKQRLIASLTPAPNIVSWRVWWRRPLVWSGAGAVAVAVIGLSWTLQRPPAPVQTARLEQLKPAPPATLPSAPIAAQPSVNDRAEKRSGQNRFIQNRVTKSEPAKPAEIAKKADASRAPAKDETRDGAGDIKELEKAARTVTPPAPATQLAGAPPPAAPQQRQELQVQAATSQAQTQSTLAETSQRAQFVAQAKPPAERLRAAPSSVQRFAFDYSLENQELVLKFAADGYFSMHFSPGLDTIIGAPVKAGSTRREHLPNNATEASIVFVANTEITTGGVSLTRENKTGTVEDPSKQRIELLLRFYP